MDQCSKTRLGLLPSRALGKGRLLKQPVFEKATFLSRRAEEKMKGLEVLCPGGLKPPWRLTKMLIKLKKIPLRKISKSRVGGATLQSLLLSKQL